MLVFGGNTHNDTSWSHGAKCFSADAIVYDIICDRWYSMQVGGNSQDWLGQDLARFGHSAVSINQTMLIYGGFNGVLKNDILAYVPGNCGIFKEREECLTSRVGTKCVWNRKKDQCEHHPQNQRPKSGVDTCLSAIPISTDNQGIEAKDDSKKNEDSISSIWSDRNNSDLCGTADLQSSCSACVSTTHGCVWCEVGDGKGQCLWRTCNSKDTRSRQGRLNSGKVVIRCCNILKLGLMFK